MTAQHDTALAIAQEYLSSWVAGDFTRLRSLFAEGVTLVLPNSSDTPVPAFAFTGADEALGYLQFAHTTFERLNFLDQQWVVSQDARFVYFHAVGDMVATPNGKDYDNVYVIRLELRDDTIVRVLEYTNPIIWANLDLS